MRSVEAFIGWVGCFEGVRSCKVADRIGLAFSRTTVVARIPREWIHFEPDLVREIPEEVVGREEKGVAGEDPKMRRYNFSDGIGYFGGDIAGLLLDNMNITLIPAAIQIRMGGVKGVLSYNPEAQGIHIRRSMVGL